MTPDNIVAHVHKYALSHGRTLVAVDGVTYKASPSAVTARIAGLRQVFIAIGRVGDYVANGNARLAFGNPADAPAVADYSSGYHQMYFDHGMDSQAAVPLTQGTLLLLLQLHGEV